MVQPRAGLQAEGLAESTPKKQLILSEGAGGGGVLIGGALWLAKLDEGLLNKA